MVDTVSGTGGVAATKSSKSIERLTEDFDKFLTLLTTQLKNQDPLDPVDTTEFTNQLVQFASVEQLIQQNTNMEKFIANQTLDIASTAVDYIGKTVEAPTPLSILKDGTALWNYELDEGAASIFLHVIDPNSGDIVRSIPGSGEQGKHQVVWDGSDGDGGTAADGEYILAVQAIDLEGEDMIVDINGFGEVTSVDLSGDEPRVVVFDRLVPISNIESVGR